MTFTTLQYAIWLCTIGGLFVLLLVLALKKRIRTFPTFTGYISYVTIEMIALLLISRYGNKHEYFVSYWSLVFGEYLLQIALVIEIARDVLRPTGTWVQDARRLFFGGSAIGLFVATTIAFLITPPDVTRTALWSMRSSIFTSFLICEIFIAMSASANRLGIPRRSHVMALGQGLAFWAAIGLMSDIVRYLTGWKPGTQIFDQVPSIAYVITLVFWAIKFGQPEQQRKALPPEVRDYLHVLHKRVVSDLEILTSKDKSL